MPRCEQCWSVLTAKKPLRCTKCKACFYCSKECQKKNWGLHKAVCTTDPRLRPFVSVEMAAERIMAKEETPMDAPKDATCYICLEGEDATGKLMRGCACRGDSAGFVHLECLTKLAVSKEASNLSSVGGIIAVVRGWNECVNCKQGFTGALGLTMTRSLWRRHRSSRNVGIRYFSTESFICCLENNFELDAAYELHKIVVDLGGNRTPDVVNMKLNRGQMLLKNGQKLEALEQFKAILPQAKGYTANPDPYYLVMISLAELLLRLDRLQEAYERTLDLVHFAKDNFGPEAHKTLGARELQAEVCVKLGRTEESVAIFVDVIRAQSRIYGDDHAYTKGTKKKIKRYLPTILTELTSVLGSLALDDEDVPSDT